MSLKWFLLAPIMAIVLAVMACGPVSPSCAGFWVQATVFYPAGDDVEIEVSTPRQICEGQNVITAIAKDPNPSTVIGDVEQGDKIKYTVVSEGPLNGLTVSCTVDAEGIRLGYMGMWIEAFGNLECRCGFVEYYVDHSKGDCGLAES